MPDDANAERQNLVRDAYMQAAREGCNPWSAVVAALDAHDAKLAREGVTEEAVLVFAYAYHKSAGGMDSPAPIHTRAALEAVAPLLAPRAAVPAKVTEEMVRAASKVFHEQDAEHGWMRRAIEAALAAARQEPEAPSVPRPTGLEPRGCPTPGACSCPDRVAADRKIAEAARKIHSEHDMEAFCADGEGYPVTVRVLDAPFDDPAWERERLPYTAREAREPADG